MMRVKGNFWFNVVKVSSCYEQYVRNTPLMKVWSV